MTRLPLTSHSTLKTSRYQILDDLGVSITSFIWVSRAKGPCEGGNEPFLEAKRVLCLLKHLGKGNISSEKNLPPSHGLIPNTSIQENPLLIYHSCLPSTATASTIESHLKIINVVIPQWRHTMYSITHFHSTTHEVLCISSGRAKLCFGGENNPGRVKTVVEKGDVIIVPAGVGHRLLDDFNTGFEMVGSYPKGKQWDMCYGMKYEGNIVKGIIELGWFEKDPLYGDEGPVLKST